MNFSTLIKKTAVLVLVVTILLIAIVCTGILVLNNNLSKTPFKKELEQACSEYLQRPLTIEHIDRIRFPKIAATAHHVQLKEKDGTVVVDCPLVEVKIAILSLLKMKVGIQEIRFVDPKINLLDTETGELNISRIVSDINAAPSSQSQKGLRLVFNHFAIDNAQLNSPKLKFPAQINADGKLKMSRSGFQFPFHLTLQTDPKEWNTQVQVTGTLGTPNLTFDVSLHNPDFENLTGTVHYASSTWTIESFKGQGLGGALEGNVYIKPPVIAINVKGTGLSGEKLFGLIRSTNDISGTCEINGNVTSEMGANFLALAKGEVTFNMKDGHLPEGPVILKTLTKANVLTLVDVLKRKKRETGIPVDTATGKFQIENGKVIAKNPFIVENKLLQIGFIGSIDYIGKTIDGDVVIHVLTLPDEVMGSIPGLKHVLLGKNRSFFPIWMKVKGPLDNPKVKSHPIKSTVGPVWDMLDRVFHLPSDLIEKLK